MRVGVFDYLVATYSVDLKSEKGQQTSVKVGGL